ncbi:MAG TPA: spore cortex-lytic enzyme [Syntrophomonadaceae bacterium]|nr:spore cortex-lytic enzyme [Syntrophomonadaceae bacterium]HPR94253.1 spore cortex-lytic enzyme [Syntrophomonadaceae bacterium]
MRKHTKNVIMILTLLMFFTMIPAQNAQAAYLGDRVLKQSMQGYDVKQLQKDLTWLGYDTGGAEGIFGPKTLNAVKQFQAVNGLTVDGVVGKQTAAAIIQQVSNPNTDTSGSTNPSRGLLFTNVRQDLAVLARLIYGEARGESYTGKVAVAAVVLNRLKAKIFGSTIEEVIFQPGAFTAVSDGQFYLQPDTSAFKAAEDALGGWDPTGGALYYWNPVTATNKWIWSRPVITTIGHHVFAM